MLLCSRRVNEYISFFRIQLHNATSGIGNSNLFIYRIDFRPIMIRYLSAIKFGQSVRDDGYNTLTKNRDPTMEVP